MLANRRVLGISMNPRRNRRWLVLIIYFFLAMLFTLLVRNQVSWIAMVLFVMLFANGIFFGTMFWGRIRGGLLKSYGSDPEDEREIAARNHAYYRAYTWLPLLFALIAIGPGWLPMHFQNSMSPTQLLSLIRAFVWTAYALVMILPQTILLWSEPDIETEPSDPLSLHIPKELR
jgi:energy-coupling factor transporter transmembrane protein EcfT